MPRSFPGPHSMILFLQQRNCMKGPCLLMQATYTPCIVLLLFSAIIQVSFVLSSTLIFSAELSSFTFLNVVVTGDYKAARNLYDRVLQINSSYVPTLCNCEFRACLKCLKFILFKMFHRLITSLRFQFNLRRWSFAWLDLWRLWGQLYFVSASPLRVSWSYIDIV